MLTIRGVTEVFFFFDELWAVSYCDESLYWVLDFTSQGCRDDNTENRVNVFLALSLSEDSEVWPFKGRQMCSNLRGGSISVCEIRHYGAYATAAEAAEKTSRVKWFSEFAFFRIPICYICQMYLNLLELNSFGDRTQIKKVKQNNCSPCVYVVDKRLDFRTSRRSLSESKKELCQKKWCTWCFFHVLFGSAVVVFKAPSSNCWNERCSVVYIVKQGAGCLWNWFWGGYWVISGRNITA